MKEKANPKNACLECGTEIPVWARFCDDCFLKILPEVKYMKPELEPILLNGTNKRKSNKSKRKEANE